MTDQKVLITNYMIKGKWNLVETGGLDLVYKPIDYRL